MLVSRLTRFRGQLFSLEDAKANPVQLTSLDQSWALGAVPPWMSDYIVLQVDDGGDEFHQLYRLQMDSKILVRLTNGRGQTYAGEFQNNGRLLSFTNGINISAAKLIRGI